MAKIKRLIQDKQQLKKDLNDVRKILLMKPEDFMKHEYLQYRIKKLTDMWPRMTSSVYAKFQRDPKTGHYIMVGENGKPIPSSKDRDYQAKKAQE